MSKHILIVDDESKLVRPVRGYLERHGFLVITAGNGRDALFAARDQRTDLIVVDLMTPELDGWELLRQQRREHDTPVFR